MNQRFVAAADEGENAWWRYALGVVLIVVVYLVAGVGGGLIVSIGAILLGRNIYEMPLFTYLIVNLPFPLTLGATLFAVRVLHQRPVKTVITGRAQIGWLRALLAAALWGLMLLAVLLIESRIWPTDYAFQGVSPQWLLLVPLALVFTTVQAATEEVVFRGYLLQGLGRLAPLQLALPLAIVNGLLFVLPHLANPEVTAGGWLALPFYFALGAVLAAYTLRSGGIEVAAGVHVANNLFAVLILTYNNSALPTPAPFSTTRFDPLLSLAEVVVLGAGLWLIMLRKHKERS